ncbi:MAG: germination protein YpeB [Oscillospiraceae bacterium]|jgi:germination protein YpeB|nr:germination protein YpeB [Oscillospiraceae bacterium]
MAFRRKRQYVAAAIAYALSALLVVGALAVRNGAEARRYKRQVTNAYRHAFTELVTGMGEMDTSMQKVVYAGTPRMMTEVCMDIYGKSNAAKMALGELPFSDVDFEHTSRFMTQVGDYAFNLAKKTANGDKPTDEEMKNLRSLSETTSVLTSNYQELLAQVDDGRLTLGELNSIQRQAAEVGRDVVSGSEKAFGEAVKSAEEEFPELPTLIYDGPFSTHIADMKPRMTEGMTAISEGEAREKAAQFFGLKPSDLTFESERGGNLPVYVFSGSANNATFEVSKVGGLIVNYFTDYSAESAKISADDAAKKALKFLDEHDYKDMKESYRQLADNIVTVNFAHTLDGVIIYPDLVKVCVALDSGNVVGFEGQGYVMNHHERALSEVKVTEEQARERVSRDLKIQSHALAVIPTGGKNEELCHQFICENADGAHYITYVNAETGVESRIVILLENENGTLAI